MTSYSSGFEDATDSRQVRYAESKAAIQFILLTDDEM
jgi:hypothetical protein